MAQFFLEFRGGRETQQPLAKKKGQMAAEESERPPCDDKVKAQTDTDTDTRQGDVAQGNQEEAGRGDV